MLQRIILSKFINVINVINIINVKRNYMLYFNNFIFVATIYFSDICIFGILMQRAIMMKGSVITSLYMHRIYNMNERSTCQ